MKVLALEPYYSGSHKAFLDGWSRWSRHEWTVMGLPACKWKWRMRHGPITFAWEVEERLARGEEWDLLFCSDMLNLAEFLGLAPKAVRELPSVAYFHENQLTYPIRCEKERDYHFGITNITTALAATTVWFNTEFNRDSFLDAIPPFVKKMPDYRPLEAVDRIRKSAVIQPPGVDELPPRLGARRPGPLRILWVARWEFDKAPEVFFHALDRLRRDGVAFRLSVLGESFREAPTVFEEARSKFRQVIDRWGYQETRRDYEQALEEADVVVSTALHEFFGLGVVEAVAAGAFPLVPRRLSYPEVLGPEERPDFESFFYQGGVRLLAARLGELACHASRGELWQGDPERGRRAVTRFFWQRRASAMDDALEALRSSPTVTASGEPGKFIRLRSETPQMPVDTRRRD